VLPRFQALHGHWPERIAIAAYVAPALLAGAAVDALPSWRARRRWLPLATAIPLGILLIAALTWRPGMAVPWPALLAAGAAIGVVLAVAWLGPRRAVRFAPTLLLLVVAADLISAGPRIMAAAPYGGFHRLDLGRYYGESGAVRFLQDRQAEEPVRFFGYDPDIHRYSGERTVLYRYEFADPRTAALIVNNRATVFGLQDVQGYNPVQGARFVEFMNALNGHPQEYHDADVFPTGLASPLLDLLDARYLVLPAAVPPDRDDIRLLLAEYPVVYRDAEVQIVENVDALPRAWIVHAAAQVAPGGALRPLASGAVDPRRTALLEERPPMLERPADPPSDRVQIADYAPESIRLEVATTAAGILVLSEIADPDWKVYVDGEPAHAYVVDHLLRGVVIPPGEHVVEWRYHSDAISVGLALTLATIAGFGALATAPLWSRGSQPFAAGQPALSPFALPLYRLL
jgi:hypothetical protein